MGMKYQKAGAITLREAGAMLGISRQRVHQLLKCGKLKRPLTMELARRFGIKTLRLR